jgi:hypothetical protein
MDIRQANKRLSCSLCCAVALAMLCLISPLHSQAADMQLQSVGIRLQIGEKSHVIGALQPESFHETDVEAVFSLPWERPLNSGWKARARLVTHAGILRGQNESALVAVAIPTLALGTRDGSFLIETGLGLAYLSTR